jgi:hypothetical protein
MAVHQILNGNKKIWYKRSEKDVLEGLTVIKVHKTRELYMPPPFQIVRLFFLDLYVLLCIWIYTGKKSMYLEKSNRLIV